MRHLLTILCLLLAVTGVIGARKVEKKRTTSNTAYFRKCSDNTVWISVTVCGNHFDDQNITTQAALRDNSGVARLLYLTQNTTTPVKYVHP